MKRKEHYKVVERKSKVLTEYFCETCGRLLMVEADEKNVEIRSRPTGKGEKYFCLRTGHHLWGHDSIDSNETGLYCEECFKKRFEEYMKECDRTYDFDAQCEGEIEEYEYNVEGDEIR